MGREDAAGLELPEMPHFPRGVREVERIERNGWMLPVLPAPIFTPLSTSPNKHAVVSCQPAGCRPGRSVKSHQASNEPLCLHHASVRRGELRGCTDKRPSGAGHRAQTTGRGRLGVVPLSNGTRPYNGSSAILIRSKVRAGALAIIGRRRARVPWVR